MYVPTIAVIVVLRYIISSRVYSTGKMRSSASRRWRASACCSSPAQFYGTMTVSPDEFVRYLQGRMADPARHQYC